MTKTFDDLLKDREKISKILEKATGGKINDFDFIIDHLTMGGRPSIVTIMLGVPAKIKKEYDFDLDKIIDDNEEIIKIVVSSFGYPELFSRSIRWMIL